MSECSFKESDSCNNTQKMKLASMVSFSKELANLIWLPIHSNSSLILNMLDKITWSISLYLFMTRLHIFDLWAQIHSVGLFPERRGQKEEAMLETIPFIPDNACVTHFCHSHRTVKKWWPCQPATDLNNSVKQFSHVLFT